MKRLPSNLEPRVKRGKGIDRHTPAHPPMDYTGPRARLWRTRRASGQADDAMTLHVITGKRPWESVMSFEMAFVRYEEDARRLCALWNACDGISTDALEAGAIRRLLDIVQAITYRNLEFEEDVEISVEPTRAFDHQPEILALFEFFGLTPGKALDG